jgi:hypothetical protein
VKYRSSWRRSSHAGRGGRDEAGLWAMALKKERREKREKRREKKEERKKKREYRKTIS